MSPAAIAVKKDKSVQIALDARNMNEITVKLNSQMPNMEELISKISRENAHRPADESWTSKLDLDYAYGQLQLTERAKDWLLFAITGGNFTGYYKFF